MVIPPCDQEFAPRTRPFLSAIGWIFVVLLPRLILIVLFFYSLFLCMTGGQGQHSRVVEDMLNTSRPSLAVTADKVCDSEKVCQQIKDVGP